MVDKNKIKELKQQSILKKQDLDLKLYLDMKNELAEYRIYIYKNNDMSLLEFNRLGKKHNKILERLAKRLNIPTILSILKNLEKIANFKKK